jgi:uncharacterized protein (TIGR02246 family)
LKAEAEPNPEAEIRAVLSAQVDAWNRGDIDAFMNGYARADSTCFVSGDSVTRGWQTVRDRYKAKYDNREKMGTLAFSEIVVRNVSADCAVVVAVWQLTRKEDKPHGRTSLLFQRGNDGWRIVHDHTSSATP